MELLLKLSFLMVQDFEPASTENKLAKQQQKRGSRDLGLEELWQEHLRRSSGKATWI
jgi:hypothetical protein